MNIKIKKLSIHDGEDIFQMLQNIPANENGFVNSVNGKSYQEYEEWLIGALENSLQEGVIDGWKVPQTTYWLYEDGKPVGYGKIRHYLTDHLLADGGEGTSYDKGRKQGITCSCFSKWWDCGKSREREILYLD